MGVSFPFTENCFNTNPVEYGIQNFAMECWHSWFILGLSQVQICFLETRYPDFFFHGFPPSRQPNSGIAPRIKPWLAPFAPFQVIFSLFPYFDKMKGGLWDHIAVCVYYRGRPSLCVTPLIFVRRIMRSPCCLCVCPLHLLGALWYHYAVFPHCC
jgi:hypothetical protein